MKENEYITVTNLVNVKNALSLIRDVTPDKVIKKPEYHKVLGILSTWERDLHKAIKIKESDGR